jgi:hypothetical protein
VKNVAEGRNVKSVAEIDGFDVAFDGAKAIG